MGDKWGREAYQAALRLHRNCLRDGTCNVGSISCPPLGLGYTKGSD